MPELPEVEVVRRGLHEHLVGRQISAATVFHPRAVRRNTSEPFSAALPGATITDTARRGKYLWLVLDSVDALLLHLGMSGQLLVVPRDASASVHQRARLSFADGLSDLSFVDQRTFGHLMLDRGGAALPAPIAHIARDPFDPMFDQPAVVDAIRRKDTVLKRALLDQSIVSGIGNIYADEALWAASLHGERRTRGLSRLDVSRTLDAAREVMAAALDQGGTSFDALYVNVNGASGYFDRSLHAYGQRDWPCARCGTPIVRESFMNRSSYSCPVCQKRPRVRRTR
ncbi:bifunctional DNA-formamidopyrimidine glycosylase/DNA-(apurinic or apyrimidinic site) lyase [Epidermidibacterium keratini]|uniref:Formamidopyrimidine-DNA glycosylase n=1 Tax=Epidermidibacterium keratini TaxID=1891644 RepID=A0A7L4YS71_9ACTN|nr:bifunctional DNA-formamidopyrimidine glycosylase/DNA-(apurinic or apyrimidinic site) lyase [Epidermidibacterium keratini]QHC01813.1 bifunctional DNA-formamidopyrimidine glycosylase/DNA-(apurinic or apyrimidinic site) lyase [Epidermidibacterium keratini]